MTSKPVTKKRFDCVEYKRAVQERIYEEIKNLSPDEQIEYFRRRAEGGALGQWWRAVTEFSAEKPG